MPDMGWAVFTANEERTIAENCMMHREIFGLHGTGEEDYAEDNDADSCEERICWIGCPLKLNT